MLTVQEMKKIFSAVQFISLRKELNMRTVKQVFLECFVKVIPYNQSVLESA